MMRSYEDRWNWLRARIEEDVVYLDERVESTGSHDLAQKAQALSVVLGLMNQADRNGPVEPL